MSGPKFSVPNVGTCLTCGERAFIVNYRRIPTEGAAFREEGYLESHRRSGVRRDAKCRGSFGGWKERRRA